MSDSRVDNSLKNIFFSLFNQSFTLVISFLSRTIFLCYLDSSYLGINGLYTNILSVLSISELGIGSTMIYNMYKPLKEKNESKICSLICYYKTLYRRVACFVGITGLLIFPFLEYFVNLDKNVGNLKLYYLLFLLNSVISYLYVYKTSVIIADQKEYKVKIYNLIFQIIKFILQTLILVFTSDYLLFLIVQIIISISSNIFLSKKAEKMYPYILNENSLSSNEKKEIWGNIKSMFSYQVGSISLNSTDNLITSILIGTETVGYYSNYALIVSAVSNFTSSIFTSLHSSVGNLNASDNIERKEFIFKVLNFMSFWIFGWSSICFVVLFQPFIILWIGEKYCLDMYVVFAIGFNFYVSGMLYPIFNFRTTTGLFKHTKLIMYYAAIINIILSVLLGRQFGLFGILVATGIARICTNFWYEPTKLYSVFFKKSVVPYFIDQFKYGGITICSLVLVLTVSNYINFKSIFLVFIIKILICLIIPNFIFYILYKHKIEFNYLKDIICRKIKLKR